MKPIFAIVEVHPNKFVVLTSTENRDEAFNLLDHYFKNNPFMEYEIHRQVYPFIDYEVITNKKLLNFEDWISISLKEELSKDNIPYDSDMIVNNLPLLKTIWNAAQKNKV